MYNLVTSRIALLTPRANSIACNLPFEASKHLTLEETVDLDEEA